MSGKKFILPMVLIALGINFAYTQESIKSVFAVKTATPKIDGIFKDSEWLHGGKADGFIQREPKEGIPASEKTEAYFLYDESNLYIGVKCLDSKPAKIMSQIAGRDNTGASDYLEIILDTFHDHRNAYFFGTTPAGIKIDGRYFNDGEKDSSWDGVWYVESGIRDCILN